MKSIELPKITLLPDAEERSSFSRYTVCSFVFFFALPILASLLLPYYFAFTEEAFAALPARILIMMVTGGVSLVGVIGLSVLIWRFRFMRRVCSLLVLPLAVVSLMGQAIMYREFGSEIDVRAMGLFQGNLPALWAFAHREFHIEWVLVGLALASAGLSYWICRATPSRLTLSPRPYQVFGVFFILTATFAAALRPRIDYVEHYHPAKMAKAPLFQIVSLCGECLLEGKGAGYRSILSRAGDVGGSEREEINERLGCDYTRFAERTVERPEWLRKRPSHVFFFLMESFGYDVIGDAAMKGLAPNVARYAEEGISVPHFLPAGLITMDAVHSMCAGVTGMPQYPVPWVLERYAATDTLPGIMAEGGYHPVFLAASNREFGAKGDSAEAYGYAEFLGCADLFPEKKRNEWGVSDEDFFQWAFEKVGDLDRPHFVTFLNVSNHNPFNAPLEELGDLPPVPHRTLIRFGGKEPEERANLARHTTYADHKMGEMVERLHARYPDALFVFMGDHPNPRLRNAHYLRVPLVFWNDNVIDSSVDTTNWWGSQMDVPATLASLVLPEGAPFRTMGQPVWDSSPDRVSTTGNLVLSPRGCFTREGQARAPFPPLPGSEVPYEAVPDVPWAIRKASAIEALSWGYLHVYQPPE